MFDHFERAFLDLLGVEKGYTVDKGGSTRYGITEAVARRHGYTGDMEKLPMEVAKKIYRPEFWSPLYDRLPYPVAYQLFDAAVNSGPGMSTKWVQRAAGVDDDGVIGPKTIAAVVATNPLVLIMLFNASRLEFLTGLSNWDREGKGWSRRAARNLRIGAA